MAAEAEVIKVIKNMPFSDYVAIEAVNCSRLKLMDTSPAHYLHGQGKSSTGFGLGRAVHSAILEPLDFEARYFPIPRTRINEKGKEVKFVRSGKHWDEMKNNRHGVEFLTADEYKSAVEISEAVSAGETGHRLSGGQAELTVIFYIDGVKCKARLDYIRGMVVTDLKTCAELARFQASAWRYKYHWQAAFYKMAAEAAFGGEFSFGFGVVESSAPYCSFLQKASRPFIEIGKREVVAAIGKVKDCQGKGEWPGYRPEDPELYPPDYVMDQEEEASYDA